MKKLICKSKRIVHQILWVVLINLLSQLTLSGQEANRDSLWMVIHQKKPEQLAPAYLALAQSYYGQHFDSTIVFARASSQQFRANKNSEGQAASYSLIARAMWNLGQHDSAVAYNLKTIDPYLNAGDTIKAAISLIRIASNYLAISSYDSAAQYYFRSKEFFEAAGDIRGQMTVNNELGVVFQRLNNPEKAKDLYHQALTWAIEIKDSLNSFYTLNNLGSLYSSLEKYDSALVYYERALPYFEEIKMPRQAGVLYANIAEKYAQQTQFAEAAIYYQKSEKNFLNAANQLGIQSLYISWASTLHKMGNSQPAIKLALLGVEYAQTLSQPTDEALGLLILKEIHNDLGQYKSALKFLERHDSITTSLNQEKVKHSIEELQLKYDQERNEKELAKLTIETQENKISLQRTNIQKIVLVSVLSIVGSILFLLFRQLKANKLYSKELSNKNKTIANALQENKLLLKEIHHRVKNNLQIVSSLLDIQSREIQDEIASEALQKSSRRVESIAKVHQSLYEDKSDQIHLSNYLEDLVETLHDTYASAHQSIISTVSKCDRYIAREDMIYVGMIMNEVVTNAFKHAFNDVDEGNINISISENGKNVTIQVQDDGCGQNGEVDIAHSGSLGTELIKMFSKKLGASCSWAFNPGTTFTLSLDRHHSD